MIEYGSVALAFLGIGLGIWSGSRWMAERLIP